LELPADRTSMACDLQMAPNHKGHIVGPGKYVLEAKAQLPNMRKTSAPVCANRSKTTNVLRRAWQGFQARFSLSLRWTKARDVNLRHLVALDIVNTKFRHSGRPSQYQRDQSELLLTCLNGAWSPFLGARPIGTASRFKLERQIGIDGLELRNPVRVDAAGLEWVWEGGNALRLAIPQSALLEHSWLEPMSIFRFLGALTTFSELESGPLLQMWALDYGSAAMLIRTQLELSRDNEWPVNRMGRAGVMYALAANNPSGLVDGRCYSAPLESTSRRDLRSLALRNAEPRHPRARRE
jgi:hypothetical protein